MPRLIDYPNRALLRICQIYDGGDTIKDWPITPGVDRSATYMRLQSHAACIGLDISIAPEGSKLIVTINIK